MAPLRWGVVGAGLIAHDFVTALQLFPERHRVVVVGDISKSNAEKFAKDHNIPKAFEGNKEVANDKEVDIVYISYINSQHHAVTKFMLEQGKPVLCEKPFAMNEKQTVELIKLAKSKKLFLMEAIWTRCFPVYKKARELIDNGSIGDVLFVYANRGHDLQHVQRLTDRKLGGGALMDVGVYGLQLQQFVFRGFKQTKAVFNGNLTKSGVDGTSAALITYENGQMACVCCSAVANMINEAIIVGTKGTLRIPDFWCPIKLISDQETYNFDLPESKIPFNYPNSAGFFYEADEVKRCLEEGLLECPLMTHDETIQLVKLRDGMRKEIGVRFDEDDL